MKESTLERKFVDACKRQGVLCLKLLGPPGWPDRTLIYQGRVMFVEFKTLEGHVSDVQIWWQQKLQQLGFESIIVYSDEHAFHHLSKFIMGGGKDEKRTYHHRD